jgi:ribosomal protein L11 methyltransferase
MMPRAFRVTVLERDEDLVTGELYQAGTDGIEVGSAASDHIALLAYFSNDVDLEGLRERLKNATVEPVPVPEIDWVARFRESFRCFRVGRFVVAPPWDRPAQDQDLLLVDPGRAFGTGTHESTRLCLGALEDLARCRSLGRVIDVGAGTAILSVAAARLGARLVVASDIDPEAIDSARTHAGLNGVAIHVVRGNGARPFAPGAFDVVLANLSAPLLVDRAPELAALRAPGGELVLSGLLETDLGEVGAAYASCGRPQTRHDGEWAALLYGEAL